MEKEDLSWLIFSDESNNSESQEEVIEDTEDLEVLKETFESWEADTQIAIQKETILAEE